jgi:hypothetical protein
MRDKARAGPPQGLLEGQPDDWIVLDQRYASVFQAAPGMFGPSDRHGDWKDASPVPKYH